MRSPILLPFLLASWVPPALAQSLPPVRVLAAPVAISAKVFGRVTSIRVSPAGAVVINDPGTHRLLLTDSNFASVSVIADSGAAAQVAYGARPGGLLAYRGDSLLFVEAVTPAMFVIDPSGKFVRAMSVPVPRDAAWMTQTGFSPSPGIDARGRIIYRSFIPRDATKPSHPVHELFPYSAPDSAPVSRMDFDTRKTEIIAWHKTSKSEGVQFMRARGGSRVYIKGEPLGAVDEFAVLSDGTLALLRRDYHLDLVNPDGGITSLPLIPYPWQRVSDSAKIAIADSVNAARESRRAAPPSGSGTTVGGTSGGGLSGGLNGAPPPEPGEPDAALIEGMIAVKPTDIPDYRPAFALGALSADVSGRVWIRTLQAARTSDVSIYDVVSKSGVLVDRVELPKDRVIGGFDATSVFLIGRDAGGSWVERVRLH